MKELGLEVARSEVDALFDVFDPDGSGSLTLSELTKQLRRGGGVELAASLQVGGAGEIVTESTNKHSLRKGGAALANGGTRLLQGFDIDEASGKPVPEQALATCLPCLCACLTFLSLTCPVSALSIPSFATHLFSIFCNRFATRLLRTRFVWLTCFASGTTTGQGLWIERSFGEG